jgi:hypothetical protein
VVSDQNEVTTEAFKIRAVSSTEPPTRRCGSCTLCCRLLPVERIGKPARTRCRHQSRTGCKVYADLELVSPDCRLWSCRWLVDPAAHGLRRPDHAGYVVDITPDFIGVREAEAVGEVVSWPVVQIWADPVRPDAWRRDRALRAYLVRVAETDRMAAMIRLSATRAVVVAAPPLTKDGTWFEKEATIGAHAGAWRNPMDALRERNGLVPVRDAEGRHTGYVWAGAA